MGISSSSPDSGSSRPSASSSGPSTAATRSASPRLAGCSVTPSSVGREQIAAVEPVIRPYIRRTPVVEVDGRDFGLPGVTLLFKLELLQQAGSFKARGAFANLLMRKIPAAGVVAASGGNHGVAVAYAAQRLGVRARVFVPTVASPAKIARIRESAAELVIGGDRYADALAASEACVAQT